MASGPPVPDITVVVPAFDAGEGVRATVDAILAQADVGLEVVVVDDGSKDDTAAIASSFDDPRVVVRRQPNRGVSAARNTGLAAARGPLVTFLDCDDVPEPGWLATFVELLAPPAVGIAFVGATYRDRRGTVVEVAPPRPLGPAFGDVTGLFLSGSMATRTALLRSIGGFTAGLRYSENTEVGLRLVDAVERTGGRTAYRDTSLVTLFDPGTTPGKATSSALRDDVRFESARYLVRRHHARLRRDPGLLASYYAILGVSAARLGRHDSAHWFGRAWLAEPTSPRHVGRLLTSVIPPARARRWPARPKPII